MFLTRLPVALDEPPELAKAMRLFPLVGALIGLAVGVAYCLAHLLLPALPAALLAIAGGMVLTGGLHEDGLADCADGFGGGRDREAKLRIMRDSAIGSYGALALIVSVALRASLLATIERGLPVLLALIAAHALSRAVLPAAMLVLPPASQQGVAAAAGRSDPRIAGTAALLALAIAALTLPNGTGAAAVLAVLACFIAFVALARRQIGGYSGDVLGALQQLAELAALLAIVAGKGVS